MTRKVDGRTPGQICYHKSGTPFRMIHRDSFIGADLRFIRVGARQPGHPFAGTLERELAGRHDCERRPELRVTTKKLVVTPLRSESEFLSPLKRVKITFGELFLT